MSSFVQFYVLFPASFGRYIIYFATRGCQKRLKYIMTVSDVLIIGNDGKALIIELWPGEGNNILNNCVTAN